MTWLAGNWLWLALGAAFIGFVLFGRRGCAMDHGGHEDHPEDRTSLGEHVGGAGPAAPAGHHRHGHGCC